MKIRVTKGTVRIGHPPHTENLPKGAIRVVPDEVGEDIIAMGVAERVVTKTKLGLDANTIYAKSGRRGLTEAERATGREPVAREADGVLAHGPDIDAMIDGDDQGGER